MELFGYLCSPFCKTKAEALGIDVPVYAGQKTVVEAKYWKKVGAISAVAAASSRPVRFLVLVMRGLGRSPIRIFRALRRSGLHRRGEICGKDQIVFLHGPTLARYDIKTKNENVVTGVVHAAAGCRRNHPHGEIYRRSWPPGGPAEAKRMAETKLGMAFQLQRFRIERLVANAGETDALRLELRPGVG